MIYGQLKGCADVYRAGYHGYTPYVRENLADRRAMMLSREKIECIFWKGYQNLKLRAWMTAVFAMAWWGVLYPELCFTEETCQTVIASESGEPNEGLESTQQTGATQADIQQIPMQQTTYRDLLKATGDDMIVKSRFLEWLEQYMP